jgi:hypothetical protein
MVMAEQSGGRPLNNLRIVQETFQIIHSSDSIVP